MKCIILAGGRGDRMWPLSRKNYPKQFIQIKNNHSIFQETIARNMAFCDEFIIVTNKDYQSIIENQMKAFRGLTYRCIYEEVGKGTAPAVVLSCLQFPDSELIFVVASDQLITGVLYKDNILEAKALAKAGYMVAFGMDIEEPDPRLDYYRFSGQDIVEFSEKPDALEAMSYKSAKNYYTNAGMCMFRNGDLRNLIKNREPQLKEACDFAYSYKKNMGNYTYYSKDAMDKVTYCSLEKIIFTNTDKGKVVHCDFDLLDVGGLDDLDKISEQGAIVSRYSKRGNTAVEPVISNKCKNTTVINRCDDKLVMVNHLKDILVVNTGDAIYIGEKGKSNDLKEIILDSKDLWDYFNRSELFYRKWGSYEILEENINSGYEVRKVKIFPGKTIYFHKHNKKNETICIVSGKCKAIVGEETYTLIPGQCVSIEPGVEHQISCISDEMLVFVETSTGVEFVNEDMVAVQSADLAEGNLGYKYDKFVLLSPAYKDYMWGGKKLIEQFGKSTELTSIAESWELSAHPDGQSKIASGKHEGLYFDDYLKHIGYDAIGWKYQGMRNFPLLIKFIDADENLSVQVHPNDDYALEHENEYGKSELWYVIDCNENSYIYCGFNRDVTKEEVLEAIENKTIESLLNKIYVKPGETYYIEAGTVHAIGEGCLICEVQQSSNSTYRLFDYDRNDTYGNKRTLEIDKALDVLSYTQYSGNHECKYFNVKVKKCNGKGRVLMSEESFVSIVVIDGEGMIACGDDKLEFSKGNCLFIPKTNSVMELSGEFEYIEVRI